MRFLPTKWITATLAVLIAVGLAACGNTGSSTGASSSTPSSSGSSANVVVKTATAMVNGKSTTILTDTTGKTLYYFTADTPTSSACSGSCASTWPPLLFKGSGSPQSASTLPGTLSVVSDANGQQVAYNGHLLYTYAGDTAPGQTNGEGIRGKWFVATPDLTQASSPTPTPSSSGSGRY
jgi:predicted lipoprotein with Yx(FWY)xxD motif